MFPRVCKRPFIHLFIVVDGSVSRLEDKVRLLRKESQSIQLFSSKANGTLRHGRHCWWSEQTSLYSSTWLYKITRTLPNRGDSSSKENKTCSECTSSQPVIWTKRYKAEYRLQQGFVSSHSSTLKSRKLHESTCYQTIVGKKPKCYRPPSRKYCKKVGYTC